MTITAKYPWMVRLSTAAVWAGAAASAVFWVLRWTQPDSVPAHIITHASAPTDQRQAVATLLGAPPSPTTLPVASSAPNDAQSARMNLTGVVADRRQIGAALIAIDGKPPRPYKVGAALENGLYLLAVDSRRALLGPTPQGPATTTLEVPAVKYAGTTKEG